MGEKSNADTSYNSSSGGYARVTMVAQVGTGSNTPCRECYVMGNISNISNVRMNIGAAATSVDGIIIPQAPGVVFTVACITSSIPAPMRVPVDNLNELQFWANTDDIVDILYRK